MLNTNMETWRTIVVHVGGEWDNQCNYIGGDVQIAYLPSNDLCVDALRNRIQYILNSKSMQGDYNIYYISQT